MSELINNINTLQTIHAEHCMEKIWQFVQVLYILFLICSDRIQKLRQKRTVTVPSNSDEPYGIR